ISGAIVAPLRARAQKYGVEAARYRAAAAVVVLGYRVRVAFHGLQAAQQRLGTAQRLLDAFAAGRDAARALQAAGNLRQLDLASEEAVYERARITVAQLELDVADRREQLQRVLGVHGNEANWRIATSLPPVPESPTLEGELEARVLRANLDLLELSQRLEGLARESGALRTAGWLPDVTVDVHGLQGDPEAPPGAPAEDRW